MFHVKYLRSSSLGFLKYFFHGFSFPLPWQPEFCMVFNSLKHFKGDHPKNIPVKLDEIGLALNEDMSFKVKVYGETNNHKSLPCHFVTQVGFKSIAQFA
jgi:hypothetical protein